MGTWLDFELSAPPQTRVLAIGVFDGVHLGHRKILEAAQRMAVENNAVPAALTFCPHPREVLFPENPPSLLMPLTERKRLLRENGAKQIGVIRFSAEIAAWKPERFMDELFAACDGRICGICVGEHWRFGKAGAGNSAFLADYCRKRGIGFAASPERTFRGNVISSSSIREAVAAGSLDLAQAMLDRPPALYGNVIHGFGVAGNVLSTPTANLERTCGILPPDGVYAGRVTLENGSSFPTAVNIGVAPTFNVGVRRIELHLLDFDGDLYGQTLRLDLLRYLRAEKRFGSADELKKQISADVAAIRLFV